MSVTMMSRLMLNLHREAGRPVLVDNYTSGTESAGINTTGMLFTSNIAAGSSARGDIQAFDGNGAEDVPPNPEGLRDERIEMTTMPAHICSAVLAPGLACLGASSIGRDTGLSSSK